MVHTWTENYCLQVVRVSLNIDSRHGPSLSVVSGLQTRRSGLVDSQSVSKGRIGSVQDDCSVGVFYNN